jgi:hypothetical protein
MTPTPVETGKARRRTVDFVPERAKKNDEYRTFYSAADTFFG